MRIHRSVTASLVAAAVLFGTAAPAYAFDCFNASRSAQGDTAAASSSPKWWSVPEFLSVAVGLNPDQVAAVMPLIDSDPRVPANFTIFYTPNHPMELASHMPAALAVNGRGIDHSDDYPTPVFDAIMSDVSSVLGGTGSA
jgi:hypothetical protein